MSKSPNTSAQRAGRTAGRFIGRSKDGTAIAKPAVKPRSFTVRELQRVIRDVQREEARVKTG